MSNYCTYSDVEVLLNKQFNASTTPTSTQVTEVITQITQEIDTILYVVGITAQPTDTNILGMLKKFCSFGSAGIVGISYFRNASGVSGSNADWYYTEYKEFLQKLKDDPEILGIVADTESLTCANQVTDGTYSEDDMEDLIMPSEDFEV